MSSRGLSDSPRAGRTVGGSILLCVEGRGDDGGWCEAAYRAGARINSRTTRVEIREKFPEKIDAEWNAVVGHGMAFAPQIARAAETNPGVGFLLTDDIERDGQPLPNLCRIDWCWDEGAFLAGVLAGLLSRSGTVGFLGGESCRTQHLAMTGFVRGVRHERPGTNILTALAGSFDNPDRGFRIANALFDEGGDVLLHTADSTGRGAIRAAEARGLTMIGFLNRDDCDHDCVAAVITTDVEGVVTSLLQRLAEGEKISGIVRGGLASGHQRFEISESVPEPVRRRVEELAAEIAADRLRVRAPLGAA